MAVSRRTLVALFARTLFFAFTWVVLTEGNPDAWLFGLLTVPLAVGLSVKLMPPERPVRLWYVMAILPNFIWGSVKGGVDVAWRAFKPRMPIAPGWFVVPVALPDTAQVVLGVELSLMPGTLVAGAQDHQLLVHVLDRNADYTGIAATERQVADMLGTPAGSP